MALTLSMLLGVTQVTSADTITNSASTEGRTTITVGGSTTITYDLVAQSREKEGGVAAGGLNGCNASPSNPVVVAIIVPSTVSASRTSVNFTGCDKHNGIPVTFSSTFAGTHSITHRVTSGAGVNTLSGADFTLTVNPATSIPTNTPPTLQLPADLTVEGNTVTGAHVTFTATASDTQDGANLPADCSPTSGSFFALGGPHTVSCSYTDSGGLTTTGSFRVTVQDTTRPSLTAPSAASGEATGPGGAPVTWTATATDIVDGAPLVSCTSEPDSTFAIGVTPVTCTAVDASGNTDVKSFDVTVSDTTGPLLRDVPVGSTTEATSRHGAEVSYTAPTASDAVDPDPTVNCLPASGSQFPIGSTLVTCSTVDATGNAGTSASFTITVADRVAPSLTLPQDLTVEATDADGAAVPFTVTAWDAVDANPVLDCDARAGQTFSLGETVVTCTAQDATGNATAPASFTVTVVDTTAPLLSDLPPSMTLEATGPDGAIGRFTPPTATDLVDHRPVVECSAADGDRFVLGSTTVTCSARDASGNRSDEAHLTVTVVDTTAPVLEGLPPSITLEATGPDGAVADFTPPTATDLVDAQPRVSCSAANGDWFPVGVTAVSCTARDAGGNVSLPATFTVTVEDTSAPELSGVPDPITVEATGPTGAMVDYRSPNAVDLVDGVRTVDCDIAPGAVLTVGSHTVNCSASDRQGNTARASFGIFVRDTTAPTIFDVPATTTVEATGADGAEVGYLVPNAVDLVDGATPVLCDIAPGSVMGIGHHTITCRAQDRQGNEAQAEFTVVVRDTSAPVLAGLPAPVTLEAVGPDGAEVLYDGPTARDAVDGDRPVSCNIQPGTILPIGTHTVTCRASDSRNNEVEGSFVVVVADTTAPTFSGVPGDITVVGTSAAGAVVSFAVPVAHDLVDGTRPVNCSQASGSTFPFGVSSVTCTAGDTRGNTASHQFLITVQTPTHSGILAPINTSGNRSAFKLNSTIPTKIQLTGASSALNDAEINVSVRRVGDDTTGGQLEPVVTAPNTTGTLMRYDATSGQYIYNLATKPLGTGHFVVTLSIGSAVLSSAEVLIVR